MPPPEQGQMVGYLRAAIEAMPHPPPLYCLVGALAVNAWGRIRSTKDVDLLLLSEEPARAALLASLTACGFQPDQLWIDRNPFAKDRVLRLRHPAHAGIPLDLIFSADAHEEAALSRRRSVDLMGLSVPVCSPEDLILLKLKAGRPHDFEDALGIVMNPSMQLDLAYLWAWADRLGLQGELTYVLRAAAPPPQP